MFTLIQRTPVRDLFFAQLPTFALSFVIAELFYKFHSFTLECGAFLLTWLVIDAAFQSGRKFFAMAKGETNVRT